jgi:hypothetical protein
VSSRSKYLVQGMKGLRLGVLEKESAKMMEGTSSRSEREGH